MTQQQIKHGFKTFTIASEDGSSSATFVPDRGAVASSIIMPFQTGSRELLFQHDYFWDKHINDLPGGWPFCFPVCARLERQGKPGLYLYDHELYQLDIHGFAWSSPWEVQTSNQNSIEFILRDNAHTFKSFPFRFEVMLHYQITPGKLTCYQQYTNRTEEKWMPYYAGFHPYFLTPKPGEGKEKVELNYRPVKRFKYNEDLTDLVGEQPLFETPTVITNPAINEQLTLLGEDKHASLTFPGGDQLYMTADGVEDPDLFSYLQLYTIPEKPFICVEPWMGFPNAMNSVKGVRWLRPGQSEHGLLTLWVGHH